MTESVTPPPAFRISAVTTLRAQGDDFAISELAIGEDADPADQLLQAASMAWDRTKMPARAAS